MMATTAKPGETTTPPTEFVSVNPLKMSSPLGGALFFLGLDRSLPVFHGSQGCTSFALVLLGRHFKESIPLQTTAMSEVTTVLGGGDNIQSAILKILEKGKPGIIGICSTGLTETKGEDIVGEVALFRKKHPEHDDVPLVAVSTPDFRGSHEDGFRDAMIRTIQELVPVGGETVRTQINVLAGSHLTVADIDYLREVLTDFGFSPIFLPDLSRSLDGIIPENFEPVSMGGTTVEEIKRMGSSEQTLVIGESLRGAGEALLKKSGVPYVVINRMMGITAFDRFLVTLRNLSGRDYPEHLKRERNRLSDAMLDAHFYLGGVRVALGLEPDHLFDMAHFVSENGMEITGSVTTTVSPLLSKTPGPKPAIGDLGTLEQQAKTGNAELLMTHSHGRQGAGRLNIPLFRMGFPIFDRLGAAHRLFIGYRGAMETLFRLSNMMWSRNRDNQPDTWYPEVGEKSDSGFGEIAPEEFVPVYFEGHDTRSEGENP
jgi:nitrogenase molybdenum-iron protein NifN